MVVGQQRAAVWPPRPLGGFMRLVGNPWFSPQGAKTGNVGLSESGRQGAALKSGGRQVSTMVIFE